MLKIVLVKTFIWHCFNHVPNLYEYLNAKIQTVSTKHQILHLATPHFSQFWIVPIAFLNMCAGIILITNLATTHDIQFDIHPLICPFSASLVSISLLGQVLKKEYLIFLIIVNIL